MHRGWNIVIGTLVIVLTLVATWMMDGHTGVRKQPAPQVVPAAITYEAAPEATLTTLSGKPVKLHDYSGKIVLLNFMVRALHC